MRLPSRAPQRDARRFNHVTLMRGAAALAVATILRGKADSSPLRAHVTLTRGPAALAVATDALAIQFCPEARPSPHSAPGNPRSVVAVTLALSPSIGRLIDTQNLM